MFGNIRADIRRYTLGRLPSGAGQLLDLVFTQAIWALAVYRFGAWIRLVRVPVISLFLKTVYFVLQKAVEMCAGISISSNASIGPGLYIGHFGGIFVNEDAKIGAHCTIGSGVVIGTRGLGCMGAPVIGDSVFIGTGAKVLGDIRVGSGARIGANAVVVRNVPEGATAAGVPARIVRRRSRENALRGVSDIFV